MATSGEEPAHLHLFSSGSVLSRLPFHLCLDTLCLNDRIRPLLPRNLDEFSHATLHVQNRRQRAVARITVRIANSAHRSGVVVRARSRDEFLFAAALGFRAGTCGAWLS